MTDRVALKKLKIKDKKFLDKSMFLAFINKTILYFIFLRLRARFVNAIVFISGKASKQVKHSRLNNIGFCDPICSKKIRATYNNKVDSKNDDALNRLRSKT